MNSRSDDWRETERLAARWDESARRLHKLVEIIRDAGGLPGQKRLLLDCLTVLDSIRERLTGEFIDDRTIAVVTQEVEHIASRVFSAVPATSEQGPLQ